MIFERSEGVLPADDYEAYRPSLRRDFQYRCAYCLRHEFFFGGGEAGEIDHHRPRHSFPDLIAEYRNLYWSCRKCNAIKSSKWPSVGQTERGLRFLDPCAEDHDDHWAVQANGTLEPLTPIGEYTLVQIRLNRTELTQFRRFLRQAKERVQAIRAALMEAGLSPDVRLGLLAEMSAMDVLAHPPVFTF